MGQRPVYFVCAVVVSLLAGSTFGSGVFSLLIAAWDAVWGLDLRSSLVAIRPMFFSTGQVTGVVAIAVGLPILLSLRTLGIHPTSRNCAIAGMVLAAIPTGFIMFSSYSFLVEFPIQSGYDVGFLLIAIISGGFGGVIFSCLVRLMRIT